MCSFKNPFTLSFELSQIASLVLFLISLLSLVDCSNRPEYAKRSNVGEVCPSYVKFNWEEILPLNEYVVIPFPYRSKEFPEFFKILLPRDTTVKDYVAVITDKLDKTNKDKASIESQLKELFKKSAFDLGIKGTVPPVTIKENLMLPVNVLFNCFKLNNEKYVRREERRISDEKNDQKAAQRLFNSLISTDKPKFEASVYLPKGMNVGAFILTCINDLIYETLNKKFSEAENETIPNEKYISFTDVDIETKFLLERVFSTIEKSGDNSQLCKLSEIMTVLKTYFLNGGKFFTKGVHVQFINAKFKIPLQSISEYYVYMEKIYVFISDVTSIRAWYDGGYLAPEYFTKINNSLSISDEDKIKAFSKLVVAALFAEPAKSNLFHPMTLGSLAEMEESINEAFEHCIDEEINDSGFVVLTDTDLHDYEA